MMLRNKKMSYPYIMAVFSHLTESATYFIDIQDAILPVIGYGHLIVDI